MSDFSLTEINERIVRESAFVDNLKKSLGQEIVGQEDLINRILIGLLANGHILLEGVPGLAKIGPFRVSKDPFFWLNINVPIKSAGSISGVNWIR